MATRWRALPFLLQMCTMRPFYTQIQPTVICDTYVKCAHVTCFYTTPHKVYTFHCHSHSSYSRALEIHTQKIHTELMDCLTNITDFVCVVVSNACGSGRHMRLLTDIGHKQMHVICKDMQMLCAEYEPDRIIRAAVMSLHSLCKWSKCWSMIPFEGNETLINALFRPTTVFTQCCVFLKISQYFLYI